MDSKALEGELSPLMEMVRDEREDGDEARGMTYKFKVRLREQKRSVGVSFSPN